MLKSLPNLINPDDIKQVCIQLSSGQNGCQGPPCLRNCEKCDQTLVRELSLVKSV